MEDRELRSVIEVLLFVSQEPVTLDRIVKITEMGDRGRIISAIKDIEDEYFKNGHGLQIVEVAGGYQMVTRPEFAPWVKMLEKAAAPSRLSRSALEVLAIIAYKQPIVRSEIEAIRGVDSTGVIKTLLERRLIKITGRKDIIGRPIMYGVTKEFLSAFGLKDLSELPRLKEFSDIAGSGQTDWVDTNGQARGDLQSEQGEHEGEAPKAWPSEGATQAPEKDQGEREGEAPSSFAGGGGDASPYNNRRGEG